MTEIFGLDAYAPKEIAEKVETVGAAMVTLVDFFIYQRGKAAAK